MKKKKPSTWQESNPQTSECYSSGVCSAAFFLCLHLSVVCLLTGPSRRCNPTDFQCKNQRGIVGGTVFFLPTEPETQSISTFHFSHIQKNGCLTQTNCSCYLGPGGQATRHLCPLTIATSQVGKTNLKFKEFAKKDFNLFLERNLSMWRRLLKIQQKNCQSSCVRFFF